MKKMALGALCLVLGVGAALAEDVKYLDWDPTTSNFVERTCSAYELVTSTTREFADGKWYVVADTVVINNGDNIKVNGSARLILCDNASLTVKSVFSRKAAIDVSASGSMTNALTIYGQTAGTGALEATGSDYAAGIGTSERSETAEGCGAIVINGGTVTATGGSFGAGIGGGNGGAGGAVTVNGGTVTATGGSLGAGIGGGNGGAGGTVTINGISPERSESPIGDGYQGCTVTATGGNYGAGIGGGYGGAGGAVTINGAMVTATGGGNFDGFFYGAGIGGGDGGDGGTVTINGGSVTVMGACDDFGNDYGTCIGGGRQGADGTVTLGENVMVVDGAIGNGSSYAKIVNTDDYQVVKVGAFERMTAIWTSGDGAVTNPVERTLFCVKSGATNVTVIFTAKQDYEILGDSIVRLEGTITENVVFGDGNDYAVPTVRCVFGDVAYLDWDDENGKMTNATLSATDYALVTAETRELANGMWYVVAENVAIPDRCNIKVNGSANLILCDNISLTIMRSYDNKAAIDVSASGSTTNALTIYGQQNGSGSLTANGSSLGSCAGIGGSDGGAGGTITINGGTVTATSHSGGAGIGGSRDGAGGSVTINGGTVTANGSFYGAGIGGGDGGDGGDVTINGGMVTATGGQYGGAGIGGGYNGADGSVDLGENVIVIEGAVGNGSSYVKILNTDEYKTVTVGAFEHMTAVWTSGDGAVTNAVGETFFWVKAGTTNVTVIFTAEQHYEILGDSIVRLEGTITENVVFGDGNDYAVPTAIRLFTVTVPEVENATVSVTTNDAPVEGFAGGELVVLSNTTVTVEYAAVEGWALQGETSFTATVEGDLRLPAEGDRPTACQSFVVTVGAHENMTAAWTSGDGTETNAINGTYFSVKKGTENVKVIFAADPEYEVVGGELVHDIGTVNEDCALEFGNLPQLVHRKVEYVDVDGQLQTNDSFTIVTAATAQFSNGWYLVEGTVSRGAINVASGCAAHLILVDDASLTVPSTWTWNGGAGIGVQPGTALTIYGQRGGTGRLTATGGNDAAGIGGGSQMNCGDITIAGGMVTATGGQRAAGIGGGAQSKGARGTIRITGGYVVAKSASMGGSGIGSGRRFSSVGDNSPSVVISGGTVWASGSRYDSTGQWGADLGLGLNNTGGSVTITGGSVLANRGYVNPAPVGDGQPVYCVTVEGLTAVESIEGLEGYGVRDITPINGKIYFYLPNGTYEFAVNGTEYAAIVNGAATTANLLTVEYLDWNGEELVETNTANYTFLTADTRVLLAGRTYVVRGEVTNATDGIEVKGTEANPTRLVLCDGAKLKVDGVADKAGIAVGADGDMTNALIICGQAEGTGTLEATGGSQGAGIGGGSGCAGGSVTVNGGTVTATGGSQGAGIGGGNGGAGGAVTIMAGKVTAKGSDGGETVGHGDGSSDSGKVMISSGLFGMTVQESWLAEGRAVFGNPDSSTSADYPYLVMTALTVTLCNLENMTAWWTCEDGSVTNVIDGEKFDVATGTKNVKVIFTPDYCYRFVSDSETGVRELASPLTADCEVLSPAVELIPGSVKGRWVAGDDVTAYTNGTGVLVIEGTGAMYDFASAADVPWEAAADKVTSVTLADTVTYVGKNALAGMADTTTVNGVPLSFYDMMTNARGSFEPSIPDDMVLVSKTALQAAKAMTVEIVNGQVELGVSVLSNADITAETANWAPVKFTEDTQIGLSADGTKLVLPIPVSSQSGFMILESGDARVVPSDVIGLRLTIPFSQRQEEN